jgi:squalene-associated FAD-dependent desaturase
MTQQTITSNQKVIVVGAGWAGLSAAVILAQNGITATLLEAAPQAGGRARSISFNQYQLDNGQHLLLGAYQQTLSLLQSIGLSESNLFSRTALRLWIESSNAGIDLKLNNLPFPLNLMLAFITAKGFSKGERSAALRFYRALTILQFEIKEDISVQELLQEYRQPASLIAHLWAPLTLAALSTPIEQASAQVFLQVLKNTFAQKNKHSNFLFPRTDLSNLFPKPVIAYLKQKNVTLAYNERVQSLVIEKGICHGVQTKKQSYETTEIILAIPPDKAAELLSPYLNAHPKLLDCHQQLQQFRYQPITTVYLEFDKPVNLPYPMLGLVQQTGHWLFDRSTVSQPNILSIVITGRGQHLEMSQQALVDTLLRELKQKFPNLGSLILQNFKVITEKQAAFSCRVGVDYHRPSATLPIPGITLAGDYTQSGYPASLEAAVQSGVTAAQLVLSKKALPIT